MTNEDILRKIKTAGEYQKKVFNTLFSENVKEHLKTIENEIKIMVSEVATELLKDGGKGGDSKGEQGKKSKVKKVDID